MSNFNISRFVKDTLSEDIGRGDLYENLAPNKKYKAKIVAKQNGIVSGIKYIKELCKITNLKLNIKINDSQEVKAGEVILIIKGKANAVLSSERTILDILQHSSGIATNTYKYAQALKGSNIKILDTRKTRPLLREFEKYSVLNGGGVNHRKGLDDSLMLKDTHLKTITNLKEFIKKARTKIPWTSKIEIECESYKMSRIAMDAGADIIMCDNMSIDEIKKVVNYKKSNYPHILIEVSGNITIDNIKKYLHLNIDAISSGSMIHQATWLDFSMKIV
jgi:nicotinate-nucleotide pyrophosphorylase (carboxylating)